MSVKHRISGQRAFVRGKYLVWTNFFFLINFNCSVSKQMPLWEKCNATLMSCNRIVYAVAVVVYARERTFFSSLGLLVKIKINIMELEYNEPVLLMHCAKRISSPLAICIFLRCSAFFQCCPFALFMLSEFCRGCCFILTIIFVCVRARESFAWVFGSNSAINRYSCSFHWNGLYSNGYSIER